MLTTSTTTATSVSSAATAAAHATATTVSTATATSVSSSRCEGHFECVGICVNVLGCAGAEVECAQLLQKSNFELEAFSSPLQHFFARSAEVTAEESCAHWLAPERHVVEPRLCEFEFEPQRYSRASERLRATTVTSRLRPHSLLTNPGNQSRWYVAARRVRTICATAILRFFTICDTAKPPPKYHSNHVFFDLQVRYAATEIESAKSARARGSYLRVSFKNTRETAQAINGWKVTRALQYLENVKGHVEAVPMRRYAGSTGRTAQGT
jgi:hypothetical protein